MTKPYTLSPSLNPNKVFILQKSELEKRLDPAFYYELRNNKFEFAHPSKKISRIVKTYSGGTPNKSIPSYWDGEICWASPKDMKGFYLFDTQDKITTEGVKNSATIVAPVGSVVIVFRSGILQHTLPVCVTKVETSINQDLKVLVPSSEILPEYLATFLKTYEKRILPRIVKHSTTVQSINQEEFNQLLIPIPEIEIQKKIIDINKLALEQKQQNEAEAENLLASIDDYLMKELGITLPEPTENTLKSRIFIASFKEISGDRFDPLWFLYLKNTSNSKYPEKPLKSLLSENPQYGANEIGIERVDYGQPRYVRITDINEIGDLSDELGKTSRNIEEKYFLDDNDILLARSGNTVGKAYLHKALGYSCFFAGYMIRFKINSTIALPYYVFAFTQSSIFKLWTKAIQRSTGQPNINSEEYKNLHIPIPPLAKQKEIANHVSVIRQQAQQLKDKTIEALALASREIENILLN